MPGDGSGPVYKVALMAMFLRQSTVREEMLLGANKQGTHQHEGFGPDRAIGSGGIDRFGWAGADTNTQW